MGARTGAGLLLLPRLLLGLQPAKRRRQKQGRGLTNRYQGHVVGKRIRKSGSRVEVVTKRESRTEAATGSRMGAVTGNHAAPALLVAAVGPLAGRGAAVVVAAAAAVAVRSRSVGKNLALRTANAVRRAVARGGKARQLLSQQRIRQTHGSRTASRLLRYQCVRLNRRRHRLSRRPRRPRRSGCLSRRWRPLRLR